ncbi:MAG: 50S ribosomal protein L10 [Candidatus ainarchaeum sp.]|nr:50S ribosomal protein L10 [Candidatus ainarchaeum sp.]
MIQRKGHNRQWKEKQMEKVKSKFNDYPTVAIATVEALPAAIERKYRDILKKNDSCIFTIKNKPVMKFFEESKLPLGEKIHGTSVVILSKKSPFELFALIKKNAGLTAAKVGSVVDISITVPEGDTGIAAGPALSDFKALKLDTQIRNGKIFIAKPKVVVEPGQQVDEKIATILNKLKIKPMKVYMKILGVYNKTESLLYLPEALDVDYDVYRSKFAKAYNEATSVAIEARYIAKEIVDKFIAKAYREAKAVDSKTAGGKTEEVKG